MQTSTEEPEVEEKPGAKQLKYRPPLARRTNLKTISFVCLEGRVIYVDFDALGARRVEVETTPGFRRQLLSKARGEKPAEIIIAVPGGNFNLQYVYHVDDGDRPVLDNLRALPKPGSPGEKSEQLREDTSEFMASLRKVTPQSTAIQFIVFHDSFLAFRNARTIAWEHGFEVGWFPFAAGRGLILGGGGGGGVQL